jgi:hypothetical protein
MRHVEIDCLSDLYAKGWRTAIEMDRWEDMDVVHKLYTYWIYRHNKPDAFNMHFTISKKNRWLVCFNTDEEMFLAAIYFGVAIRN